MKRSDRTRNMQIIPERSEPDAQIQILTELTGRKRMEIIMVLARNGEMLPKKCIDRLFRRLDELDAQICEGESEYKEIVKAIKAIG